MLPSEGFVLFDEPVGLSNFQALHIRNYLFFFFNLQQE